MVMTLLMRVLKQETIQAVLQDEGLKTPSSKGAGSTNGPISQKLILSNGEKKKVTEDMFNGSR